METDESQQDAQLALNVVESMNNKANKIMRLPFWLSFISVFIVVLVTYFSAISSGNSLATFIAIVGSLFLIVIVFGWIVWLKTAGIKLQIIAKSNKDKLFTILLNLIVFTVIIGGQFMYNKGIAFAPLASSIVNGGISFYLLFNHIMLQKLDR